MGGSMMDGWLEGWTDRQTDEWQEKMLMKSASHQQCAVIVASISMSWKYK
jgi:hypothetical protein